jgi:hypothetical protein
MEFDYSPPIRTWKFGRGFIGFHFGQRLISLHHIAFLDFPGHQCRLMQSLAQIG